MAFQLSPGVVTQEIDLTTIVPSVSTTAGAFAGYFNWGPVNVVVTVPDELTLVKRFTGNIGPDANSAIDFFTCASFLAYGNNLNVVRSAGANSFNSGATALNLQIANENAYQYTYLNNNNNNQFGAFVSRYPGVLGNSLSVSIADGNTYGSWAYSGSFSGTPGTSTYVSSAGGLNDEVHIIVVDAGGLFTGNKGQVLETFPYLSKASDATLNGDSNYYKQVIFNQSQYIYVMDPPQYTTTANTQLNNAWGTIAANRTFANLTSSVTQTMTGGTDDIGSDATTETAWGQFSNKQTTDISLVLTGGADITLQQYIIDNIVTSRADCVGFVSPPYSSVVNQAGNETTNITTWLNSLARSNSYTVADSGWKYMYDKYNQVYRWIPLNGDIAGLCVYTDQVRDPWYSPAGFNRGAIKNAIKLAWNPNKTYRDTLYSAGVNPVVTFPGQGTVLYGDKTLQSKPSAFDRINVRRLFIVLEKAISKAAEFSLFEFNDTFTQAQFVAMVTPFLRDIQGRRGITDFKVVCDSTNNTPQVIDSNQFVGDIYIKPARSINYIQLNFVAVATGVDFSTIVGAV